MIHGHEDQIVGVIAMLVGLVMGTAALTNWSWYYTLPTSRFLEHRLGRHGARLVHGILALGLVALGIATYAGWRLPLFGR